LKIERNALCPCGSGKKFKKCCGSPLIPSSLDCIALNRMVAYKGDMGRRREAFCLAYLALKKVKIAEMEDKLTQKVTSSHRAISCSRGCVCCCNLFVEATLQECEGIVYYLYQHEEALRHFLKAFDGWRASILNIESCYRHLDELGEKITNDLANEEEKRQYREECGAYARAGISCPFLAEGACSIYQVRPYVCAGLIAATPRAWCNPSHPRNTQVQNFNIRLELAMDMPYFAKSKSNYIFSSMPPLVYRILTEGYDALSSVPGLEKLKEAACSDLEMPGRRH
jgi:Fe-S-cluster containining protein